MSKNLTLKESVQYAVRLGAIQAADDHASIQAAISTVNDLIDNLSSETTLTYGDVIDGFSSDVMVAFVADSDTTDVSTYTTASKLTHKKAMELTLEISQFQASRDHDSIQAAIDNINGAATITDDEIFALYEAKTVEEYHLKYDTFLTYPQRLLNFFLADNSYKDQFEGYAVNLNGNTITLTKEGSTTHTFNITYEGMQAENTPNTTGVQYVNFEQGLNVQIATQDVDNPPPSQTTEP